MKTRNEVTGKKAATVAGKLLDRLSGIPGRKKVYFQVGQGSVTFATISELRTIAASALTQTPNKVKK